jgi:hypothetical protein
MATDQTQTQMLPKRKPLLDLSTFTERHFIRINGEPYEFRNGDEFAAVDYFRLARLGEETNAMLKAGEGLDEESARQLSTLLDTICRMVLIDVPEEVLTALTDMQRTAIAQAFTELLPPSLKATRAMLEALPSLRPPALQGTGAKPSRGSRASTGARRRHG